MAFATKIIPILEDVKKMLAVTDQGPGTQQKPNQMKPETARMAKAKVDELNGKSKKNRPASTQVVATGAKRKK